MPVTLLPTRDLLWRHCPAATLVYLHKSSSKSQANNGHFLASTRIRNESRTFLASVKPDEDGSLLFLEDVSVCTEAVSAFWSLSPTRGILNSVGPVCWANLADCTEPGLSWRSPEDNRFQTVSTLNRLGFSDPMMLDIEYHLWKSGCYDQ